LDKNFHLLMLMISLIVANSSPIVVNVAEILHCLAQCGKFVLHKIVPRFGDGSAEIPAACQWVMDSQELMLGRAACEVMVCPWLLIEAVDSRNVPLLMAGFVSGWIHLPFFAIASRGHQHFWKWVNIAYTELLFNTQGTDFQPILIWILGCFRNAADLCIGMYPSRFVDLRL
jgi:hypothetical protein